jgi:hypothetical protein
MINLLAILSNTAAALGSFLGGNTRAVQAHTSLDKAIAVHQDFATIAWPHIFTGVGMDLDPVEAAQADQAPLGLLSLFSSVDISKKVKNSMMIRT